MLNEQVWRNINCDVHAVQQNKIENGHKLKPFIVFNGGKRAVKRMNEDRQLSGKCVIPTSANDWMNESLTEECIQCVVGRLSFAPRFLVWDTCKCHMTNGVKEAL